MFPLRASSTTSSEAIRVNCVHDQLQPVNRSYCWLILKRNRNVRKLLKDYKLQIYITIPVNFPLSVLAPSWINAGKCSGLCILRLHRLNNFSGIVPILWKSVLWLLERSKTLKESLVLRWRENLARATQSETLTEKYESSILLRKNYLMVSHQTIKFLQG